MAESESPPTQEHPERPANPIFILGITQRSGTNFLHDLVCLHPDCGPVVPIREDSLLAHADKLQAYVEGVYRWWNEDWGCDSQLKRHLARSLYEGLAGFVRSLSEPPWVDRDWPELRKIDPFVLTQLKQRPAYLVLKTPSVKNLSLLAHFPYPLVVLVRDGRDAVASGMKAFGWSLEEGARKWAAGAEEIARAREAGVEFSLVRYESLLDDPRTELERVFAHAGLDAGKYDFDAPPSLPVRGSSTLRGSESQTHWQPLEKSAGFNPQKKWKDWPPWMHARFNWIAGASMQRLGYEPLGDYQHAWYWKSRNQLADLPRSMKRAWNRAAFAVRLYARRVLRGKWE